MLYIISFVATQIAYTWKMWCFIRYIIHVIRNVITVEVKGERVVATKDMAVTHLDNWLFKFSFDFVQNVSS